ncbi:lipopolysaccharide biosynthesis protein [Aliarcobacter butzleri]|uniref:lipopolysaccharide biosynthesis protein n=1 Tax=Aliarcobacter butzleri TaxID=28197 RepID=UPI001EDFD1C7|nr:oligosaccharide flippase family protein [Aliarcobacter butzleri]MCG3695302.1 oligosaccharide flippase family protein [Aliarcobacter butzleri]
MINKLKPKSEFSKNVLTLMTGTTIGQVIPISISPILTRIYTPEEFGTFALYMAFISIGAAIVTGKYEMAILLPKRNEYAKYLVVISILLTICFSILLYVFYYIFFKEINIILNVQGNSNYFYLVPIGIFLFAFYNILLQWMNRQKEYKLMTKNRFIQATSIALLQLSIGFIKKFSLGLIIADILGRILAIILIFKSVFSQIKIDNFSLNKLIYLTKRYKKFPKWEMPATVLNISSFQISYIFIPILFTSAIAGFYFLVFRVLMMPISLLGNAILEVFKNRAIEDFKEYNSCREIYKKIFLLLLAVGIFPTFILIFFGQEIFAFLFGKNWQEAGIYAQILAPLALLRLISAPLSYVFFIREKLELDLAIQFIFLILVTISLFISYFYSSSLILVTLLSISGSIFYIIQIVISYRLSYVES